MSIAIATGVLAGLAVVVALVVWVVRRADREQRERLDKADDHYG